MPYVQGSSFKNISTRTASSSLKGGGILSCERGFCGSELLWWTFRSAQLPAETPVKYWKDGTEQIKRAALPFFIYSCNAELQLNKLLLLFVFFASLLIVKVKRILLMVVKLLAIENQSCSEAQRSSGGSELELKGGNTQCVQL